MSLQENRGFTLIELIVVITLLTGLSTVLLLNSSDSRAVSELDTATRQLESMFMQAQAFGKSGKAFPEGSSNFDRGYGVYVHDESGTVILYGGQGDLNNDGDIEKEEEMYVSGNEYETIQLYGGVTVTEIRIGSGGGANRDKGYVLFRRGESEAHIYSENAQRRESLSITLEKNEMTREVVVEEVGLIYSE